MRKSAPGRAAKSLSGSAKPFGSRSKGAAVKAHGWAKSQSSATPKKSSARTGAAARVATALNVDAGTADAIARRPAGLRRLLLHIGKAVRSTERSGEPVSLTVTVAPDARFEVSISRSRGGERRKAETDDLADARNRGTSRVALILAEKDMLSADDFAALIGSTRETVRQKRMRREILGLEGAKRGFKFPRWQLTADGRPLPALPRLFDALGGHPWAVYRFLLQRHPELGGRTGLDALKHGEIVPVLTVAAEIGQGSFS